MGRKKSVTSGSIAKWRRVEEGGSGGVMRAVEAVELAATGMWAPEQTLPAPVPPALRQPFSPNHRQAKQTTPGAREAKGTKLAQAVLLFSQRRWRAGGMGECGGVRTVSLPLPRRPASVGVWTCGGGGVGRRPVLSPRPQSSPPTPPDSQMQGPTAVPMDDGPPRT